MCPGWKGKVNKQKTPAELPTEKMPTSLGAEGLGISHEPETSMSIEGGIFEEHLGI